MFGDLKNDKTLCRPFAHDTHPVHSTQASQHFYMIVQ